MRRTPYPPELPVPAGERQDCACLLRFRSGESQSGRKLRQICEAVSRRPCACGVRFRPPVGDMEQEKRSSFREALSPAMEKRQKFEAESRRYCACGVRFRPPVGDMRKEKRTNCRVARNAAEDALIESKRGGVGGSLKIGLIEIENVGRAPCAREGPPNGEDTVVPGPKIRAAHGIGPVDRGVFMENAPASRRRIPPGNAELAEERNVGISTDLHDFLEGLEPTTCANCRSRWFSAQPTPPGWAYTGPKPPEALGDCARRVVRTMAARPFYGSERKTRSNLQLATIRIRAPPSLSLTPLRMWIRYASPARAHLSKSTLYVREI